MCIGSVQNRGWRTDDTTDDVNHVSYKSSNATAAATGHQ